MTAQPETVDQAVITRHRAMWATGDYSKLTIDLVAPLGPILVEASGVGAAELDAGIAAVGDGFLSGGETTEWGICCLPRARADTMSACPTKLPACRH